MNSHDLKIKFLNACSTGDLNKLKNLLEQYNIEDLESDPKNSIAFEMAFRNNRIELIDYVLTNKKINQKLTIPTHFLRFFGEFDSQIIEYICKSENVKAQLNVLENKEHYSMALDAAIKKDNKDLIKYLIVAPETKCFWQKKLSSLHSLCNKDEADLGIIKLVINQISLDSHNKREKNLIDLTLEDCLITSLRKSNVEVAHYFIFDLNIQMETYNRDWIKEHYPKGEKLFVVRELNENLNKDLKQEEQNIKKKPKL